MATDNNDIFPEDITKMLEKMDKTIEENSSNLNADVHVTVHTNTDNNDIDNAIINLDKQIDETLDTLDRGVNQHKGAFDIWKTFGVELDTDSFGSDDANKDRNDKDAVYDQLALLAKVLNKNPKLLGTLTSINGKNLKLVLGDSNERAEYLNRANKSAYLEHGYIINKKEYDNNTDTIGFTGKNHNIITAPKSKNQNELDETLFHEYGHRILNKILDELGISHNVKGETVTQFINRLKNRPLTAIDVQQKAREDFINAKIDASTYNDMFHNPEKYINKPNKKIDTIIDLFTVINNAPLLLNKGSKKEYVNDFQEVFARSFANYVAGMANFYTDKRVNIEKNNYNTVNTKLYNSTMDQNFVKFLSLLNGENLIGKDYDNLLNFDTEYQILTGRNFKGKNSTEITKRLLNILNSSKGGDFFNLSYSKMDSLKTIKQILTDNHIELSKYNFSPTNIYKILSSLGYNSAYIEKDENGNQISPIKNIVHEILGAKTNQDIENLEKLSKLGKLIEKIKDIGDKIPGITINNIKDVYNILSEIGYDNLSKEEIEILRNSYDKLPTHVKTNLRGYKTSLDAAMSKIPTSDIENKNENYYEEKIKQDVTSFNSFADAIKSLSDTFKNNFESAIESSASYFKKAFESAIVSYGDVLARVGSGTNPFTDNTFTGGYNPSIIDKTESRVGTPFVTKDGRKLYSKKAIDEYIKQPYQQASHQFYTENKDIIETIYGNKTEPLMLGYDPSSTFEYNINQHPNDIKQVLSLSDRTSDIQHWRSSYTSNGKKTYEPIIEDAVIVGTPLSTDDTFNRAIRKASFVNSNAPLMLGYDGPTVLKNDVSYIYENTTDQDKIFARNIDKHSKSRRNRHKLNRIRENYYEEPTRYITAFDNLVDKLIETNSEDINDIMKPNKGIEQLLTVIYKNNYDTMPEFKSAYQKYSDYLEGKFIMPGFPSEQDVIDALPEFPKAVNTKNLPDFPPEQFDLQEASLEETVKESLESFNDLTEENEELTKILKEVGLEFQRFSNTDRTILTAGKPGFNAGGKAKTSDLSTGSWITYEKDEKSGEFHFKTKIPDDKKTLKEFMDVNESVVHMQKHLEDYYRFQHNNATNMEVTPLEYLNYKYGERAQNLQKRMNDENSGFASTIYKIGGVEHTYAELMKTDAILASKLASFEQLANQIAHANDVDEKTGQSTNPLTTYKWLRELSELEKDIKKRTANAIKEQQTIYKELSDISKEGEKIAEEGIKQADKMLAGDSTYKSIFGKYKIPELSRSGKFSLTDSEKAMTEFFKDQIKTQQELLKDTNLDKSGREKIRDEIKNLNEQLNDYTTGTIAERAKEISGLEDSYKKNVIPMLDNFNKTFGHVFNTNADIDFEAVRQGGFGKLKELSKFIDLNKFFNMDNVKKYASELSKNVGTMLNSGVKMFQSAFSKISSIVTSVVKTVTIAITGAAATVTAAITGFVAGFTAMGKSIVGATDVYRKQTIALGGVYQSPTKTNRMINSVYDITRSMPINYTQAVQTLSEMSAIPALQTILKSNDTQKSDQLLQKMFKVITAMTTMRPDQKSSDAIFSLRNAFAGDLRSLQRRFDLPTSNIMNVRGTMGLAAVKTDPMAMLDSLENYFDSFLDVGTINKISDTISVIVEKIKGAIDLFKANIGNAGFYELVAEDFRKIRDIVVNFVTSEDGKNLAKRISDVFGNVYESIKSMAVKVKDIIAGVFNIDSNTLSGMFMKGLEFFAKSVNYIDKLLNVETVTKFVKDLVKTIVDSKDIVLGYIDDIKNKFIDIVEPVLKFAEVVTDAMNDIINVLKKTGLSDKGIIYLWLLGPSNVLNMIIGGIGAIKAAIGLLVVSTGVLYNSIKDLYGLIKPAITFVLGGLKKGLVFLAPYLTYATAIAVSVDLIYHNWEKLGELGMNVVGSIAIALEPVTNTLSDMWNIVDHMFAIGGSMIKSIFNAENWKNAAITTVNIIENVFKMALSKALTFLPDVLPFLKLVPNFQEKLDMRYEESYGNLMTSIGNSKLIPDDVVHSWDYHTSEISKLWNKNRFGVWGRMTEGDFSDFTNLYKTNAELYNPEGKELSFGYTGQIINGALSWMGDKTMALDKSISSIPDKISNFFKWLVSDEKSDSSILNSSNKTLGLIKNGLDYIKNNMKSSNGGTLLDSIISFASNPLKSIYNAVTGTVLNSYSAPYESPMWNKRLTSMALDVDRLQFQRGSIWSRNSKSDKSEKMFKTDYGEFGFGGLQDLNLKKLDNLKNINKILDEVGKVKLNAKDQEEFDKHFQENLENARKKTEEIDNLIRDNIEASVMLMQDALGSSKLNYLKNDVTQFVMAKNRQLNSQLEQDMNDSIRLQYAVYFATTDEFDETLVELRNKYHDVNDMYSDISNGNVDLKDMTELGRQILTEFAKRYEAERDYLWNLEKQRAYIEVTTQNINKMGLSELSGNWSNLMNSPYKKIRDAAGNQYMDIMKENLEQDTMGSMVRKVRDVAINSFTDMKNAVINAVQEIVKSTQQTIKNGLDKFIAEGGTVKPMFKELFENIKKNFFGIYTNEAANKLTEFIYGSSFEDNKTQDPMIKLDTDIKDFNTSVLQKIDEVIVSNEKFLNDAFNKWLEENNKSKQETPLYRGSAYIVEKQGSNLAPLDSKYADFNTISNGVATRRATDIGKDSNKYDEFINEASRLYDIDSSLIKAVINTESSFKMLKANKAGAIGLMQVTGGALSDVNRKFGTNYDINNPKDNIMAGTGYLRMMLDKFKNTNLALAAYNSGAKTVIDAKGIPNIKETQNYIPTVNMFKEVFDKNTTVSSKTVEKPISSIDNNIEEIKNEITNVTNGDISNITRTGYSEINAPTINNIISGTTEEFNLNNLFDGINIPSGISELGNHVGFGVIGKAIKSRALDILFGKAGSKSNSSKMLNLVFNKDKGYFDSVDLTDSGSNVLNGALNAAGVNFGGVGSVLNVAQMMNTAGANLQKPETPLKGIWGQLFGTVENVESKFGGASVGSFLGNLMSGKGIWDSLAKTGIDSISTKTLSGTKLLESLKGANGFTKVATGLTSTLFGKSAGATVAKTLTGGNILGMSLGTALPVVGAVAYGISKLTKTKDKTAEGRARYSDFQSMKQGLLDRRYEFDSTYALASDMTRGMLTSYNFGNIGFNVEHKGGWKRHLKGTARDVAHTDATDFINSLTGYHNLLMTASNEQAQGKVKLDSLQSTDNMEYLMQSSKLIGKQATANDKEMKKYQDAMKNYAGKDANFKQTLFDGKEYTLAELEEKVEEFIKTFGDLSEQAYQLSEEMKKEKLNTEYAKLDYKLALDNGNDPLLQYKNEIEKLNLEWASVNNGNGYTYGTREWYEFQTKMLQATQNLENATEEMEKSTKELEKSIGSDWVKTLSGIRKQEGTYLYTQVREIANLYDYKRNDEMVLAKGEYSWGEKLTKESRKALEQQLEKVNDQIDHLTAQYTFRNRMTSIKQNISDSMIGNYTAGMFGAGTKGTMENIRDYANSLFEVNKYSGDFLKTGAFSGYDDFMDQIISPLVENINTELTNMVDVYNQLYNSGYYSRSTGESKFLKPMNNYLNQLDTYQTAYISALQNGNQNTISKALKNLENFLSSNSTYFKQLGTSFAEAKKLLNQNNARETILSSISGYDDYEIANTALKNVRSALGNINYEGFNQMLGAKTGMTSFTNSNIKNWFGVTGEDPYTVYYEWQKKNILQRIENEQEGSDEWYQAELDLWNLMMENAKYLKEKAEKTSQTIEEMLDKINETAKTRVAEEAKTAKGDIIFFDLGASRDSAKLIDSMIKAIKTNDPKAQELVNEFKKKKLGS